MNALHPGLPWREGARVLLGLALAPPVAGVAVGLVFSALGVPFVFPIVVYLAALFGWPGAVVLGIPAYLFLRRWRGAPCLAYVAVGMLLGLATAAGADVVREIACADTCRSHNSSLGLVGGPLGYIFGPILGAIAGAAFWRIVWWERASAAWDRPRT
jgi:hypothetical protein